MSRMHVKAAARCIAAGGLVAYPTEAVFGLGCDPRDHEAVRRVLAAKRRPEHKGLILIGADFGHLAPYVESLELERMAVVEASWPGPNTWLLPVRPDTPRWLCGRHQTLAVRVTAHPIAADLCRAWGGALVSTSANLAGRPPARTALQVRMRLGDAVDLIVPGACGPRGRPSTIRDGHSGAVVRA